MKTFEKGQVVRFVGFKDTETPAHDCPLYQLEVGALGVYMNRDGGEPSHVVKWFSYPDMPPQCLYSHELEVVDET